MKTFRHITAVMLCLFLFLSFADAQNTAANWGATYLGGSYNAGSIFYSTASTLELNTVYSFPYVNEGKYPFHTNLCQASNGKMYGLTSEGGKNNSGVLFEYDTATGVMTKKIDFIDSIGKSPRGSLIEASNGNLYGMTYEGGLYNFGVIFEYNPVKDSIARKFDFNDVLGKYPYGSLVEARNGKLYGLASLGGSNGLGVLFEYDILNDTLIKKVDFDGMNKGTKPLGSLIESYDSCLYGMTQYGGANLKGVIFKYSYKNDIYTRLKNFDGVGKGSNPCGSLVQAPDSIMYGLTSQGGTFGIGVLFSYNPKKDTLIKKINFNEANGTYPDGSLIITKNGKILGQAAAGGVNDEGVLFSYNRATSTLTVLMSFERKITGSGPNTLCQASDGNVYGLTIQGGDNDAGVLYKIDTAAFAYEKMCDFNKASMGMKIKGSMLLASNRKLYGTTSEGGKYNKGVLFEVDPDAETFNKKADFNGTNGANPGGGLIEASNGKLYGTATNGGANDFGVLYEYDPVLDTLIKKIDFNGPANGKYPYSALFEAANNKLYGTASSGGTNGYGVLFEYNPANNSLLKRIDFDDITTGSVPMSGALVPLTDNLLYGMTREGGSKGYGVIYEFDTAGFFYTRFELDTNTGTYPEGGLLNARNGKMYGLTFGGGGNGYGTLFEYDAGITTLTVKQDFYSMLGSNPQGTLMQSQKDLALYGLTGTGGGADLGVLFRYDYSIPVFTRICDFNGMNGASPVYTQLTEVCDSPKIMSYPVNDTLKIGENATFGCGAFGNALTFQWLIDSTGTGFVNLKNDTTYNGISKPLLNVLNVAEKHFGYKFRCRVTSLCPVDTLYSDTVLIALASGLAQNRISLIDAYPNPASDALIIASYDKLPEAITIMDLTGRTVYACKPVSSVFRIDIHDWPAGVYLIKASAKDGTEVLKVIKQ